MLQLGVSWFYWSYRGSEPIAAIMKRLRKLIKYINPKLTASQRKPLLRLILVPRCALNSVQRPHSCLPRTTHSKGTARVCLVRGKPARAARHKNDKQLNSPKSSAWGPLKKSARTLDMRETHSFNFHLHFKGS